MHKEINPNTVCVDLNATVFSNRAQRIRQLQTALLFMIFESHGLSLPRASLKCKAQLCRSAGDSAEHQSVLKKNLDFHTFSYWQQKTLELSIFSPV